MQVLILGGTRFVGRAVTQAALDAGHEVTLFNRGNTNPSLFPEVERLRGDRESDLSALEGRSWDVVFDVAAYTPEVVERSTRVLGERARHYVFVSTLSVYADQSRPHAEDWPLLELSDQTPKEDLYGARKVACEQIVERAFGARCLIVRAGMITGPFDPTDRLSYWPRRLARGGTVLAPGSPDDPLQFIDARDLAEWMVRSSAADLGGTFNVTGSEMSFRSLLESCRRVTAAECQTVWIPSDKLLEAGVDPWMGVPLWIAAPGWEGANRVDISRAMANGLTLRPLDEVVGATWAWDQQRRHAGEAPDMLPPEQEAEIFERVRQTEQPVTQG